MVSLYHEYYFFVNPMTTPPGRKVSEGEEVVNRGHYVLPAKPKVSAHTLLGPTS